MPGSCRFNANRSPVGEEQPYPRFSSCHECFLLSQCGRAADLVGLSVDEVAFKVEVVVDVGMDRDELLMAHERKPSVVISAGEPWRFSAFFMNLSAAFLSRVLVT